MRADWRDYAACQGIDPELWYPMKGDKVTERRALAICSRCPVREECLADAVTGGVLWGIWGGTTEAERAPMISAARTKPAPTGDDGVQCPRCGQWKAPADFAGADDVINVRCNQCRGWQRRWAGQRRREGIR